MCPWHQHSTLECQCWLLWLSSREILPTSAACRGQYSVLIAFSLSPNTGSKSVSFIICTAVRSYPFLSVWNILRHYFYWCKVHILTSFEVLHAFRRFYVDVTGQTISHSFVCLGRFKELILYYYVLAKSRVPPSNFPSRRFLIGFYF